MKVLARFVIMMSNVGYVNFTRTQYKYSSTTFNCICNLPVGSISVWPYNLHRMFTYIERSIEQLYNIMPYMHTKLKFEERLDSILHGKQSVRFAIQWIFCY